MDEEEWLSSRDWRRLVEGVGGRATDRKLRLFAVAVCRRIAEGLLLAPAWRGLVVAEKMADGVASVDEVDSTRYRLGNLLADEVGRNSWEPPEYAAAAPLSCLNRDARDAVREAVPTAWLTSQPAGPTVWEAETVARLRDIFGNPFRPVAFDPSWRTDTAVSLARQMYEARDFGAVPILADALQDAGCEHPDILGHCRDPQGVHVRGCWVVDLVLGKS